MRPLHHLRAGKTRFRAPAGLQAQTSKDHLRDLETFGSNPGRLRARFYVPERLSGGAPLVVVLHGCTQTAAVYDHGSGWSRLADHYGFAVLFPEQQRSNNPNLCFNWFAPEHSRRDAGEPLSIKQMIETFAARYQIDRQRIFITGLSAGGAMTSTMLATYPEVFAGGAIIAGLAYRCATTVPEAFERMRGSGGPSEIELQTLLRHASSHDGPWPRVSIWQGGADHTVQPANAEAILSQWRTVHGLNREPTETMVVNGHPRRVWRNSDGQEAVEMYTVTGMGHGTPIDVGDCGAVGPHMLDAGISSTRLISDFWSLGTSKEPNRRASAARAIPVSILNGVTSIQKTITDALRSAGLMR